VAGGPWLSWHQNLLSRFFFSFSVAGLGRPISPPPHQLLQCHNDCDYDTPTHALWHYPVPSLRLHGTRISSNILAGCYSSTFKLLDRIWARTEATSKSRYVYLNIIMIYCMTFSEVHAVLYLWRKPCSRLDAHATHVCARRAQPADEKNYSVRSHVRRSQKRAQISCTPCQPRHLILPSFGRLKVWERQSDKTWHRAWHHGTKVRFPQIS
jgi:hypothetical protein